MYSQSIHASANPLPVGSSVTLSSPASVSTGAWMFNSDIIVIIFPGNVVTSNIWKDRLTLNLGTNYSSLTIRSLQVEDSGIYTLEALNSFRAELTLSVQGKTILSLFKFIPFLIYFLSMKTIQQNAIETHSRVCFHVCPVLTCKTKERGNAGVCKKK